MATHSTIPDLLITALKGNTAIAALVAGRVHYQTIPQSSKYPHIYIARQSRDTETLLDGSSGPTEDRFIVEVVAEAYTDGLCSAVADVLNGIECVLPDGTWIYCTDLTDVDDTYQFKSADSDALFLHGFQVTVYHS